MGVVFKKNQKTPPINAKNQIITFPKNKSIALI